MALRQEFYHLCTDEKTCNDREDENKTKTKEYPEVAIRVFLLKATKV